MPLLHFGVFHVDHVQLARAVEQRCRIAQPADTQTCVVERKSGRFAGLRDLIERCARRAWARRAQIEMGVEIQDQHARAVASRIEMRAESLPRAPRHFVTAAQHHRLRPGIELMAYRVGQCCLRRLEIIAVTGDIAGIEQARDVVGGQVRQRPTDRLRTLTGANASLVAFDARIAGEAEQHGRAACRRISARIDLAHDVELPARVATLAGIRAPAPDRGSPGTDCQ